MSASTKKSMAVSVSALIRSDHSIAGAHQGTKETRLDAMVASNLLLKTRIQVSTSNYQKLARYFTEFFVEILSNLTCFSSLVLFIESLDIIAIVFGS
jgi:hypothetical protein